MTNEGSPVLEYAVPNPRMRPAQYFRSFLLLIILGAAAWIGGEIALILAPKTYISTMKIYVQPRPGRISATSPSGSSSPAQMLATTAASIEVPPAVLPASISSIQYRQRVKAMVDRRTDLINISAEDSSPTAARALLDVAMLRLNPVVLQQGLQVDILEPPTPVSVMLLVPQRDARFAMLGATIGFFGVLLILVFLRRNRPAIA